LIIGARLDGMSDAQPVEDVLRHVAVWAGRAVAYRPVAGGSSHRMWRVDAGNRSYLLRVLDPRIADVGVGLPADQEIDNTLQAARSGVGARVFEALPQVRALVLEYLPGRALEVSEAREPATARRIAGACRRLHGGPAFSNEFDIGAHLSQLREVCLRHDVALPDGYHDRMPALDRAAAVLRAASPAPAPCHNELLPGNLLDVGGEIRAVDYQLSGNNDPAYELGAVAAGAGLDPDQVDRLAYAYFGAESTAAQAARVRLGVVLANASRALRATVHHGLLGAVADPADGTEAWRRAAGDLDSAELGRLLQTASGRAARRWWRRWPRRVR
jgi:thiamine kinase-like enzyme